MFKYHDRWLLISKKDKTITVIYIIKDLVFIVSD